MNLFLDTSSLFKLYHQEVGTSEIDSLLEEQEIEQIFISEIAKVEFISAVSKRMRMGDITEGQADTLYSLFEDDYQKYTVVLIDRELMDNAINLIRKYRKEGLRTLDAIQLASILKEKPHIHVAKTSDVLLNQILKLEQIQT